VTGFLLAELNHASLAFVRGSSSRETPCCISLHVARIRDAPSFSFTAFSFVLSCIATFASLVVLLAYCIGYSIHVVGLLELYVRRYSRRDLEDVQV
jgi:hypothetical protein